MGKNNSTELTRIETLAILSYLINKTDENHLTIRKDILAYAKEKFDIDIAKPERITACLEHLEMLSSDYNDLLPFNVKMKQDGERFKYYAERKNYDKESIDEIVNSINHDEELTTIDRKHLIGLICDTFNLDEDDYDLEKLSFLEDRNKRIKKEIKKIMESKNNVSFSINNFSSLKSTSKINYYNLFSRNSKFVGKFLNLVKQGGRDYVNILIPNEKDIISIDIRDIKIIEVLDFYLEDDEETVINKNYKSNREYLSDSILASNEDVIDIDFYCKTSSFLIFKIIRTSFEKHFNKRMKPIENGLKRVYRVTTTCENFIAWVRANLLDNYIVCDNEIVKDAFIKCYENLIKDLKTPTVVPSNLVKSVTFKTEEKIYDEIKPTMTIKEANKLFIKMINGYISQLEAYSLNNDRTRPSFYPVLFLKTIEKIFKADSFFKKYSTINFRYDAYLNVSLTFIYNSFIDRKRFCNEMFHIYDNGMNTLSRNGCLNKKYFVISSDYELLKKQEETKNTRTFDQVFALNEKESIEIDGLTFTCLRKKNVISQKTLFSFIEVSGPGNPNFKEVNFSIKNLKK